MISAINLGSLLVEEMGNFSFIPCHLAFLCEIGNGHIMISAIYLGRILMEEMGNFDFIPCEVT